MISTNIEMKDSELRGIVLQKFYDRRREGSYISLTAEEFANVVPALQWDEIIRVCGQLAEHGLLHWQPFENGFHVYNGEGHITAFGVDVIEGNAKPNIAVSIDSRSYTFNQSNDNIVGDHNVQAGDITITDVVARIDNSAASSEQKKEARGIITRAFQHPAVGAVLTPLAEGIARAFKE